MSDERMFGMQWGADLAEGPWEVAETAPTANGYRIEDVQGVTVATVWKHDEVEDTPAWAENAANLMAASPELYEVARWAKVIAEERMTNDPIARERYAELAKQAIAAIAKAEGRAS